MGEKEKDDRIRISAELADCGYEGVRSRRRRTGGRASRWKCTLSITQLGY